MTTPKPQPFYVSNSSLVPCPETWDDVKADPRGVLMMWEEPRRHSKYIMGLDPSYGITGWSRSGRNPGDYRTDNGAIVVYRVDGEKEELWREENGVQVPDLDDNKKRRVRYRDVQVAEYAAPVDAVEIARVANVVGRVFSGNEEDQCELIHEAFPGPGVLTTQELLRLNYGNLWMWEFIDSVAEQTNRIGWRSSMQSQQALWQRTRHHLLTRHVRIQSRWLRLEYSDAELDVNRMRARAASGFHDDRMQASNMALWAAHKWTYDSERSSEPVTRSAVDFQNYAPSPDDPIPTFEAWKAHVMDGWE